MAAGTGKRKTGRLQRAAEGFDYVLVMAVAGLLIIGLMMVYSATFDQSYRETQSLFKIASRQFLWVGLGLVVLVVFASVPYDWWRRVAVPLMGGLLFLLVMVLLLGVERFGARRSFISGSVQPGELAKLIVVIYAATWLYSKGDRVRDVTYGLIPFAVLIGLVAGLIVLQPDVSTAILIVLTASAMFFFAGADLFQLTIGGVFGGATFFILVNRLPHARDRLDEWKRMWQDPRLVDYHMRQALIALGSGGVFGVGLGQGQQKLGNLPTQQTDSIFAVIGEELGLVGCLVVVGLFVLLVYRGFKIASETSDPFAALLAYGITCWLGFQALINMAVITGLAPFTGVALPFISFGGSAMLVSLAGVGLLLSISRGRRVGRRVGKRSRQGADLDRGWGNRGTRLSRPGRHTSPGRQ